MKKLFKKVVSVGLTAALTLSMAAVGISSASALSTNDYYNTYTTVADIKNRDGCSAMQGMAVGSTYLYTVKIKDDNSGAVLQKTNKNTGATTNLTNSTGSIYTYLNHANDMDVTTIDGYSQLFVATMATGGNSLVRIKVNGSKATKSGGYTLMYNGAQKSASAVAVERTDANNVYLLLKIGSTVYRATVPKAATSGTINVTKAFTLNTSSVKINGSYVNLSSYTHQGMGYHDGKIYVPLWGGGAGKSNQSVIAVYDTHNASGSVTSDPFLSFRVTSGAYSGFEIESCDISSDGQMYFNVNRWTSKSGNYDAILRFNNFVANGFNPDGYTDAISGGQGTVYVRGWAFDKDCASMSIPVHVYIGGPAGSGEGHAITANTYRNDVNGAFGCGDYHGFDATIGTSLRGSQPVYLYAINTRKGTNVMIGSGWVNITSDTSAPGIGNVRITEVSQNGYRVTCDVWDDTGVTSVRFPTWTTNNGQDDLVWHDGSISGNTATCYISKNDHKGEYGTYITHIYAYDGYGNQSCNGDTSVYLEQPLSIYNYGVVDIGADFYANISGLGKNLSVAGWDGNNVTLYDKDGSTPQNWHFIRQSNGSYKIVNMYSNKCLDVNGAANADGANVQIWDDNGGSAQRWFIYNVNGKYALKAECSDRVLDITGGSSANGTNIQTYTFNNSGAQLFDIVTAMTTANLGDDFYANISCYGKNLSVAGWDGNNVTLYEKDGSTPQNWHFVRQSNGSYKIYNMYSNKCLDVCNAAAYNGANVQIWDNNDSNAQNWYIYSTVDGRYVFMAGCSSCVLDVAGASGANGTNFMMGTSHGGYNQQFEINRAMTTANLGNDFYANISCFGKNLSINGWDGDNVILYDKDGSTPQNWHFIRQDNGSYKIVNMYNNKCLDVSGASSSNNANVGIYDDTNQPNQRWYIYSTIDGKYVLMAGCSSCVIDVCGASSANGANIMMGTSHGGANQQFTIEPVNCATVTYSGHVQGIGDVAPVSNWQVLGTTGQALRLEGVRMSVNGMSGDIQYRVHVQNYGWMDWQSANAYAGTTGEALRIEAIEIRLTGEIAQYYNVEYQSAVENIGWMSVCRNGETSGTTGQALRMEAIKVRLVHK